MKRVSFGFLCSVAAMACASPALAASDYFLVIEGVDGEATTAVEVQSWSWGATNSGASVQADGSTASTAGPTGIKLRESPTRRSDVKVTASQNTQSLRESPSSTGVTKLTASQNSQSLREVNFGSLAKLDEVTGFTLVLAPGDTARKMCASGKHIANAHLVKMDGTVYDLSDLVIGSCDASGEAVAVKIASGRGKEFKGHVTLLK